MKTRYLEIVEDDKWLATHKTKRFIVKNRIHDYILGVIKYNSHWRQYCFYPTIIYETAFSSVCLYDIESFIESLSYEVK